MAIRCEEWETLPCALHSDPVEFLLAWGVFLAGVCFLALVGLLTSSLFGGDSPIGAYKRGECSSYDYTKRCQARSAAGDARYSARFFAYSANCHVGAINPNRRCAICRALVSCGPELKCLSF